MAERIIILGPNGQTGTELVAETSGKRLQTPGQITSTTTTNMISNLKTIYTNGKSI